MSAPRIRYLLAAALALVAGAAVSASADALRPALEGAIGIPIGPDRTLWDYQTPTSLLSREDFVVAISGQAANLLTRKYFTGKGDRGYTIGLSGGAVVQWEYGVSGVWALGSGQSQQWSHPNGLYRLTPSPKVGLMAISHAWRGGPWELGGTFYRTSFSLNDTFTFDRYPSSARPDVNQYLYDLIPAAIGRDIQYDALGNRLAFFGDLSRRTPIGRFGAIASGWLGSVNWLTQHENTIARTDAQYDRWRLAGTKTGEGSGGGNGVGIEGRWDADIREKVNVELRAGRGTGDADATMWLRNPSEFPVPNSQVGSTYEIEPRNWGGDTLSYDSWRASLKTTVRRTPTTALTARFEWDRHLFDMSAFGRTPVLTIDDIARNGVKKVPIEQAAYVRLDGETDVFSVDLAIDNTVKPAPWGWYAGLGVLQIDGSANVGYRPVTRGIVETPSAHEWAWSGVRLANIELRVVRRVTSQVSVSYGFRQYVPLSGDWSRDGDAGATPGKVSGFRFGSFHQIRASMNL